MNTEEKAITLEDFEKALRKHDWHYVFSDDPTWTRRGRAERDEIERMMLWLKSTGHGDEAKRLYDEISPRLY